MPGPTAEQRPSSTIPSVRRIQKSGPLGTTNYLYDGSNSMEEMDASGNVSRSNIRKDGLDEPLAEFRSGTTSYYEQDGIGSVLSLSNSSGTLASTYIYDSFGNPRPLREASPILIATLVVSSIPRPESMSTDTATTIERWAVHQRRPDRLRRRCRLLPICVQQPDNLVDPWGLGRIA